MWPKRDKSLSTELPVQWNPEAKNDWLIWNDIHYQSCSTV